MNMAVNLEQQELLDTGHQRYVPGTNIPFNPQLIEQFTQEHKQLLKLFSIILQSGQDKKLSRLNTALVQFQTLYNKHVLDEYSKLYTSLDASYKNNRKKQEVIRRFRSEMRDMGQLMREFFEMWRKIPIHQNNLQQFLSDARIVGNKFMRRINQEERELYDLYQHSA